MKVKEFTGGSEGDLDPIDAKIQTWLNANPTIKIHHIGQSEDAHRHRTIVLVFYTK